jgi:hypothetical protein
VAEVRDEYEFNNWFITTNSTHTELMLISATG